MAKYGLLARLAHLVLHGFDDRQDIDSKNKEREANAFASVFLMPERGIVNNYSNYSTITSLLSIKQKWNVSLAALNYRLHSLALISDWNYRANCIAISKNCKNRELFGQQPEIPQLIYNRNVGAYRKNANASSQVIRRMADKDGKNGHSPPGAALFCSIVVP